MNKVPRNPKPRCMVTMASDAKFAVVSESYHSHQLLFKLHYNPSGSLEPGNISQSKILKSNCFIYVCEMHRKNENIVNPAHWHSIEWWPK